MSKASGMNLVESLLQQAATAAAQSAGARVSNLITDIASGSANYAKNPVGSFAVPKKLSRPNGKSTKSVSSKAPTPGPGGMNTTNAFVARGAAIGSSTYSMGPVSRTIADCNTSNGVTVRGACMLNWRVVGSTSSSADRDALRWGTGATDINDVLYLSFDDFDSRLLAMASVHLFYRCRRLSLHYQAECPTTQAGLVALGITDDYRDTTAYRPTVIREILTQYNSASGNCWQSFNVPAYRYDGAKVWTTRTHDEGTSVNDVRQLAFFGRTDASVSGSEIALGRLLVAYEFDFYEPIWNNGAVALTAMARLNSRVVSSMGIRDRRALRAKLLEVSEALSKAEANDDEARGDFVNVSGGLLQVQPGNGYYPSSGAGGAPVMGSSRK